MENLFLKQLEQSRNPSGEVDLEALGQLVTAAYAEASENRRRTDRDIELMIRELDEMNQDLEKEVENRTSELRLKRAELELQNRRFNAALTHMTHGLAMFDSDARLVICNRRWREMYSLPRELAQPGKPFEEIIAAFTDRGGLSKSFSDPHAYVADVKKRIQSGTASYSQHELHNGKTFMVSWQPMRDGGWVSIHEDITERRQTEKKIEHMAWHDSLTNLPNRTLLMEVLKKAVTELEDRKKLAIIYVDLDRFKAINDTLGLTLGDHVLKAVAQRLKNCIKERDTLANLGGDEFVILQAGVVDPTESTTLANRITKCIREPYELEGHSVVLDASIGIALCPDDGTAPDELLKNADLALRRAKMGGKGSIRAYEPDMDAHVKARRELEVHLRRACEDQQFELMFQPIVNLAKQQISSCEALIRWNHPERGIISPAEFIPVAEDVGLINQIGEWVLREACRTAVNWPESVKVSINVSPTQLVTGNLVPLIIEVLRSTQIPPERLEVEITEEMLVRNPQVAEKTLRMLNNIDVPIAMDDFGTGYSSLNYLCKFPFDKIKIDKSFIDQLPNREAAAIISAIAGLARSLDMRTTAEGIETSTQLKQVQALGCTEVQGYLISKPIPAQAMTQMLLAGDATEKAASA